MYKEAAFKMGENFHRVAVEMVPDDWFENDDGESYWFIPSIVNLAFACELYIKSLISNEKIIPKHTHRWDDLFKAYPDLVEILKNMPEFKDDEEFDSNLRECSKVFVDWRYCFEPNTPKSVDIIFLEKFTNALHFLAKADAENPLRSRKSQ